MANDGYRSQQRIEMIPFVPTATTRVLEVGCGEGGFMSVLRAERPKLAYAVGIEPFCSAAERARDVFEAVLNLPVEDAIDRLQGQTFDCIVCNDVLEHLVDPWAVLRGLLPLLAPDGAVVASLPNIRHWPTLNALFMRGEWVYQDFGVLDRTHLRFFTQKSLPTLFDDAGLQLESMGGINGSELPWKIRWMNRLFGGRFDDCRFKQFACVARHRP